MFSLSSICLSYSQTYSKEFVFAKGMSNLHTGISLTVSNSFLVPSPVSEKRILVPPIGVFLEGCVFDFSEFGSIGGIFQVEYTRYQYSENNDGQKTETNANQIFPMIGLAYHYTLVTRLEVYLKGLGGFTVYHSDSHTELQSEIIFQTGAGIRCFFTNSIGGYLEGGYTTGYLTVGVTYRWL